MSSLRHRTLGLLLVPLFAGALAAQHVTPTVARPALKDTVPSKDSVSTADTTKAKAQTPPLGAGTVNFPLLAAVQYLRPRDQRGINMFETSKNDTVKFNGLQLRIGTAFAQQFQGLSHENTADPKMVTGVDQNRLVAIGKGFNNADANLYLDVQLADGIRVAMTSYLSARHHNETWVKDGYIQIDKSPLDVDLLKSIMKYTTLKVGHFEINYGDQHFRRTDNGNALFNPFVGNFVMDAFTTEIGAEAYVKNGAWFGMGGVTAGESKGMVQNPTARGPAFLAKLGYDEKFSSDLRVRFSGSMYKTNASTSSTLYNGDRAGSRYYSVIEPVGSSETSNAWSGALQPGLKNEVTALVFNPSVKIYGLELFGNIEQAKGKASAETAQRTFKQYVGEAVYRFANDQLYVGGRYNRATGPLLGMTSNVTINRTQLGGGWFVTPNLLSKIEWVQQKDLNFLSTDVRNGGKFNGFVIEGVVAF